MNKATRNHTTADAIKALIEMADGLETLTLEGMPSPQSDESWLVRATDNSQAWIVYHNAEHPALCCEWDFEEVDADQLPKVARYFAGRN